MRRNYRNIPKTYDRINCSNITPGQKKYAMHTNPLGGGQLGYLALVIPPTTYITIPGAAQLVRPTDSGMFTLTTPTGIIT